MKTANYLLPAIILALSTILHAGCTDCNKEAGTLTNALEDTAWESSVWISATDAEVIEGRIEGDNSRSADGANWFMSTVQNRSEVISARWMTSGLGVFDIYVNGILIGKEALKPGFTHYAKTKYSFTYDITELIRKRSGDENVFSAQVTPGWWADKIITPGGHEGMIGKKCAFRAVLELTYADGAKEYHGTDTDNWKAGIAGQIRHASIFDGEEFDAREVPGYLSPEKLGRPELNTEFQGSIFPSAGAEIYYRDDLAMAPVQAYIWTDVEGECEGEYGKVVISRDFEAGEKMVLAPGETLVIDFGQNAAAVPHFIFKAEEGTELTCLTGELLNDGNGSRKRGMDGPEGSVHRLNLRAVKDGSLKYTFGAAKGYSSYMPRNTFFGYRFASITATDKVIIKSIRSIPVTSITAGMETGRISTGNESINKLIRNSLWGMYSNYLSVPTDCPQRDERLGWTADTQVFTETGTFFADIDRFMHKWMRDMRDTQTELGGFPGVAPVAQYGAGRSEMMRLGWADAGVIVPWTIWKQFGDTSIIEENWAAMDLFMNHINDTRYDHERLAGENGNYQWADWLSYEPLESSGGGAFHHVDGRYEPRPEAIEYWNYLCASYWAIDAGMMRDMAAATGRDACRYEKMAEDAKDYIRGRFINEDGTFRLDILNTMQTPALFALKNNILEGAAKEGMIARLRENFRQHGNCLQTGFLGTSILMSTLTGNGMVDLAYELLFQRKNPSWLYSVDNGATTIWERWNSYTIENGMGPQGMNSFNHYAYGCVCEWIWETAAGISSDRTCPGFRRIIMKPVPDRRLGHIDAEYRSAAGLIRSSWRYEGDQWIWNFSIPEGAVAEVTIPGDTQSKEYQAGSYQITL